MVRKVLMLFAVIIMASTIGVRAQAQVETVKVKAQAQSDSLMQNLAKSLNALIESKMTKTDTAVKVVSEQSSSSSKSFYNDMAILKLAEDIRNANLLSYGIVDIDYGHGDFFKKYDSPFVGGFFQNSFEKLPSPHLFNNLGVTTFKGLVLGYEWSRKSREFYDKKFLLKRSYKTETLITGRLYHTNEYQISLSKSFTWKFARDFVSISGILEAGVVSNPRVDSVSMMLPYLSAGVEASIFCAYGSVNWMYSDYCKYKSIYIFMSDVIPVFEFGVVSPTIKINQDFMVGVKAGYTIYEIFQKGIPGYNANGQYFLDMSNIVDTNVYKGSISFFDHYGNLLQFGVFTWDLKKFYPGFCGKFNLKNIGRYF